MVSTLTRGTANPASLRTVQTRKVIASSIQHPSIISAITIGKFGQLNVHSGSWQAYWRPVEVLHDEALTKSLAVLQDAWTRYIASGFELELAREYSLSYFELLNDFTERSAEAPSTYNRALRTVLGFENFVLQGPRMTEAAATTTARNPVYLLGRLKWPTVPHSTRFLPLITLVASVEPESFGHYRRYSVDDEGDLSVLVFPKNDLVGILDSLTAIGAFVSAIGASTDPFARERSLRLWEHIVHPLVAQKSGNINRLEILDIGSSTGAVVGRIAHQVVRADDSIEGIRVRISLLDSSPMPLSPEYYEETLADRLDAVDRISEDYREWLDTLVARRSQSGDMRIAFACKVFDMGSRFEVRAFRDGDLSIPPATKDWFDDNQRSVAEALKSPAWNDRLLVSTQRFATDDGHVIAQPSLSDYFRALAPVGGEDDNHLLHLPVRIFDSTSLETATGKSVLQAVLRAFDYLVIEDADLRPSDLLDHLRAFGDTENRVLDVTNAMKLVGNYAYVLWDEHRPAPPIEGDRLA